RTIEPELIHLDLRAAELLFQPPVSARREIDHDGMPAVLQLHGELSDHPFCSARTISFDQERDTRSGISASHATPEVASFIPCPESVGLAQRRYSAGR